MLTTEACAGQIRWALNNIAQPEAPPCRPVLEEVYNDTSFLQQHAAPTGFSGNSLAGVQVLQASLMCICTARFSCQILSCIGLLGGA